MARRVLVFGPAYLDRVLRVDRPILPPDEGGPLDLSVGGSWISGEQDESSLALRSPDSRQEINIGLPPGWPIVPTPPIRLDRPIVPGGKPWRRDVRGIDWQDDLGGMGAGFAAALGGTLVSALGPESDPVSSRIASMLAEQGIRHLPSRVPDTPADWTLLVSSGPFGDKLPIGFRGCHASLSGVPEPPDGPFEVLVVCSLTNRLARSALESVEARVRVFAPTLKNMLDTDPPLSSFADRIDLLCCNRQEWEALPDRDELAQAIPILSITDGPAGGLLRVRNASGSPSAFEHFEPAFPRDRPPQDTNRAGEAYASTLLTSLLDAGWPDEPPDAPSIRLAARRASAAAGLVINSRDFGFPTLDAIRAALDLGRIP